MKFFYCIRFINPSYLLVRNLKFFSAIAFLLAIAPVSSYAQWTAGSGIITTPNNVGIGTTFPSYKLTVSDPAGTTQINIATFNNSTNGSYTAIAASGSASVVPTWANGSQIAEFVPAVSGNGIISAYTGALLFQTSYRTTRMTISSNGYVGIGTTAPDQTLTVKGTIHSSEVKVDLNVPGPDYVFRPDYHLPELKDVKNYISKNNHLPEIPSAKEMETEGVNLSEMNMKLLKKVEELTLYLIKKDEQLKSQQKDIDVLKHKVALINIKNK